MTVLNGTSTTSPSRPLTPGVYAPIPTFFLKDSEDLDLPTLQKHVIRMANSGIGILLCGSMGEANHLSFEERGEVIKAARAALDSVNLHSTPIIAGTGVGSTRETIRITKAAADAGADYAIVIPSGYFAGALGPDRKALKRFFKDVAEASPIPVMIYNYPSAAGGIDMDSDLIEEMAIDIPNLCGVKLTCGNVGKLTRICSTVSVPSFSKDHPRKNKDAPFLVLGGFVDFLLPSLYANGHGAITGLANAFPHTLQALWQASLATLPSSPSPSVEKLEYAQYLQGIAAHADRTIAVSGIAGTKWLMEKRFGYGGGCRLPLSPMDDSEGRKLLAHKHVVDIEQVEKELEKQASTSTKKPTLPAAKLSYTPSSSTPITNGVPVSNPDSSTTSPSSPAVSTPESLSTKPSSSLDRPSLKGHSRSGSLTNGVRSLIGSLRKKKPVAV